MATIRAVLRDGREVTLAAKCGGSIDEMIDRLTEDAFTGSGSPLASAKLVTATGEELSYSEVNTFMEDADFVPGVS